MATTAVSISVSARNEHGPDRSTPEPDTEFSGFAFKYLRAGLHRYLLRHLSSAQDIEDLTQEVYLRLLRFADKEKVKSPRAYVFRVAFHVLYEFRHHRNRTPIAFDSDVADQAAEHLPDEAVTPDEVLEQQRRSAQIGTLVAALPPMQRLVLLLTTREQLSYDEIAARLGISASTARVHLFRAIAHLKNAVAKE